MGRRSKRDADYFPFYVKEGRTLTVLQQSHGLAGIGFFTNLMRLLASTPGHYVPISDPSDRLYFFARLGVDEITGVEMLKTTVETGKIDRFLMETKLVIYCPDLVESLSELYSHRTVVPFTIEEIISKVETHITTVETPKKPPISSFPTTSNAKEKKRKVKKEEESTQLPEILFPPTNGRSKTLTTNRAVYHLIEGAFLSKTPKTDFPFSREGPHLKKLEEKCLSRPDPEGFAKGILVTYWQLTESADRFWGKQPFMPSALNSGGIWPRVLKEMESVTKQTEPMNYEVAF